MKRLHFVWALLESFQCSRGNNIILSYMNCRCSFRNFLTDICVFRQFSLLQCDRMKQKIYYLCNEWSCKLMQKPHLTKFLYHEVLTWRCQNQYTMAGRCVTMPLRWRRNRCRQKHRMPCCRIPRYFCEVCFCAKACILLQCTLCRVVLFTRKRA